MNSFIHLIKELLGISPPFDTTGLAEIEGRETSTPPRQLTLDRASNWDDFIGNTEAVERLKIELAAIKTIGKRCDNILFYGNAGTGKTTLAKIIASKLDAKLWELTGSSIKNQQDLVKFCFRLGCYSMAGYKSVVFVDEIHGIIRGKGLSEDIWLPLLEENILVHGCFGLRWEEIYDIPVPKMGGGWLSAGTNVRQTVLSNRCDVGDVTWIGATTNPGELNEAMRRRFPITISLQPYTIDDIKQIILKYAEKTGTLIEAEAVDILAERARGNPAFAVHHNLRQVLTCVQSRGNISALITKQDAEIACKLIGLGRNGLTPNDIRVLRALETVYPKGMGLKNLAATANIEPTTVESIILPFLQQCGWTKTTHNRQLTEKGKIFLSGIDKA